MRSSAIAVSGLRKAYGDKTVLDGIDLDVPAGTVFSLLGPHGAGKTTTVNVLTTLIKADGGTVRVAGHDIATEAKAVRAATMSVSSVTSSAPWPRLTSASNRSSMAVRRSPSSRVTAASNAALSCKPTSCMAAPRHNARASRSSRTRRGSSSLRARRGVRTAPRRQRWVPPSTGSRASALRPALPAAPCAAGKPSAARRSPRRKAGAHPRSSRRAPPSGLRDLVRARGRSAARATGRPARRRGRRCPYEPRGIQASRSAPS